MKGGVISISSPAPQSSASDFSLAGPGGKRGRKKPVQADAISQNRATLSMRQWKFILVNERSKDTILLPLIGEREALEAQLKVSLKELGFVLSPVRLADKLNEISRLSFDLLRRHKRVSYVEPRGWKIFRIGRFRIIMNIIEKENNVVEALFIIRYRDGAYAA